MVSILMLVIRPAPVELARLVMKMRTHGTSLTFCLQYVRAYASWGVDYLKYDNCNTDGSSPKVRYPPMRDALNKTGRPVRIVLATTQVTL